MHQAMKQDWVGDLVILLLWDIDSTHKPLLSMNILFISGKNAPGYEQGLSWRFGDSLFMTQWLNTQVHFFNQHWV